MLSEPPGALIGPYEVVRRLEGQVREVYLARRADGPRDREYALVLFEVRDQDAQELEHEVERCKQLQHPSIVRIVDVFAHGRTRALAFESVHGTNLHRLLRHLHTERERLADRAIYYVGHCLFGALAEAHQSRDATGKSRAIVHGQLGPHQIFLSWDGEVKILGFGMSRVFRLADAIVSEPEEVRPYMAPEAREGYAPTPRANVYSAAAILWALLAQRMPPTDGAELESLSKLRPDLPRALVMTLDQALEPAVTRRAITSREIAGVLERLAGTEGLKELRWNMEVYRALATFDDGFLAPESFPPSGLSKPPPGAFDERPTPDEPSPASDSELPTGTWKVESRAGSYAFVSTSDGRGASDEEASELPPVEDDSVRPPAASRAKVGGRLAPVTAPRATPAQPRKGQPSVKVGTRPERSRVATLSGAIKPIERPASPPSPAAEGGGKGKGPSDRRRPGQPQRAETADEPTSPPSSEQPAKAILKAGARVAEAARKRAHTQPFLSRSKKGRETDQTAPVRAPDPAPSPAAAKPPAPLPPPAVPPPARAAKSLPSTAEAPAPPILEERDELVQMAPAAGAGGPDPGPDAAPAAPPVAPHADLVPVPVSLAPGFAAQVAARAEPAGRRQPLGRGAGRKLSSFPTRWIVAVALTAVVSFALGLIVASGPVEIRVGGESSAEGQSAQPAPPRDRPTPPTAAPPATAGATATAATTPGGSATASPAGTPAAGDDGASLAPDLGLLVVHSKHDEAHVYVRGVPMGAAGEKITVACGLVHVRLGSKPLTSWFGAGRPLNVACQGRTEVEFGGAPPTTPGPGRGSPGPAGRPGRGSPRIDTWIPPEL